jgi:hypothetical protein
MIKYTFIHPIKEQIEIWATDWYDAQCQLLQKVAYIMDWELYFEEETPLFI